MDLIWQKMDKQQKNEIPGEVSLDQSFKQLFHDYYPKVVAYVSSILDPDAAEDITQDVFLYIWENRKRLDFSKGLRSYLYQSAYTRCIDYLKKDKSAGKYQAHVFFDHALLYGNLLKDNCTVLEKLFTEDIQQRITELMEKMPEPRRKVFLLSYREGFKNQEIADQLHIPLRTVESHRYLAIRYLRKNLQKRDFFLFCGILAMFGTLQNVNSL